MLLKLGVIACLGVGGATAFEVAARVVPPSTAGASDSGAFPFETGSLVQTTLTLSVGIEGKTLSVVAVSPKGLKADDKVPVVIWSQGANATVGTSLPLARTLASAGYLVIIPRHADALDSPAAPRTHTTTRPTAQSTSRPAPLALGGQSAWAARAGDVRLVLDRLNEIEAALPGGAKADREQIAIVGESLGAFTALLSAGATPIWQGKATSLGDPRVRAVVVVNPREGPDFGLRASSLAGVKLPLLTVSDMSGSGKEPWVPGSKGERFVLSFERADAARDAAMGAVIRVFLDAQLKADEGQKALLITGSAVAPFRNFATLEEK